FPGVSAAQRPPRQLALHAAEPRRRRALEGKDRLLLVADREDAAAGAAATFAGEELLDQRADHLPLPRAGVLRLVNQQVVDPAVKLVLHPARGLAPRQERDASDDQIVEIEEAAR